MAKGDPRSPAQQAHAERLGRLAAERKAAKTARITAQASPPTGAPDPTDVLLRQLGEALIASGTDRALRNQKIDELTGILSSLSLKDYPELVSNPVVVQFVEAMGERQAELHPDDPPGTIYNKGQLGETKKPWQWRDLAKYFPAPGGGPDDIETVEITPNETIVVTWNGLPYQLVADVQQWIPKPHYYVYQQAREGRESARQHAQYLFRQTDRISGPRADPSIVGVGSALMRGRGDGHTAYRPGAGGFNPYTEGETGEGGEGGES